MSLERSRSGTVATRQCGRVDAAAAALRIAEATHPEKIILFGSYAYGVPHTDSDVDLLIIMDNARNMKRTMDLIAIFDSEPFASKRVRLFDVKNGRPSDVVKELETVFKAFARALRVVGNLPYNISTPILFRLLDAVDVVADQHFMLQREVVERMAAAPGGKDYGRLSVMLQWRYDIESVLEVPISISALGAEKLEKAGIQSISDFSAFAPALGLNASYDEQVLFMVLITGSQALFNHLGIGITTKLTDLSGYLILGVCLVLTIALLGYAPHIDLSRLWTFHNYSGDAGGGVWPASGSMMFVFLLGLLLPVTWFDRTASLRTPEKSCRSVAELHALPAALDHSHQTMPRSRP